MEMKLVLVDSNRDLCNQLWSMLSLHRAFHLEARLDTIAQLQDYIRTHEVDAVFTNNLPAEALYTSEGLYLSAILAQTHPDIQVVVYSDAKEVAAEAWRCHCAGFLQLPFDPMDLQGVVNQLIYVHQLQQTARSIADSRMMLKTNAGFQLIRFQDILFVEHINRSSHIVTGDGKKIGLVGYSMSDLEKMLEKRGFFRCHQSYIINLSMVAAIHADNGAKRYAVSFNNPDGKIAVSREKYMAMVSLLREKFARLGE